MSTYITSSKDGRLKEADGNNMMYMSQQPNVCIDIPNVGILDRELLESRIRENEFGLLRDRESRSHEMLLMRQMGSDKYQNANVRFSSLVVESTQEFETNPYGIGNDRISDSMYVKAAQQLLDEVVNVKKSVKQKHYKHESMNDLQEVFGESNNQQDNNLLSAAEKQDLRNKMTKLSTMLNDVDRRYKQYYHQMQIISSSFDIIAGCGSAKPYTNLALQTISKHFRRLRDTINSQIKLVSKSLGETDSIGNDIAISRLRFVDLRQNKHVQEVGMMHQHIWRPQRGLPENCVTILRAWLFEHFLHPYPKDSEKTMLAKQTGLTRSQVSNWFINARVRLWKPMVERIYQEESADAAMDSNSSSEIAPKKTSLHQAQDMDMHQSATSSDQTHDTKMANTSFYSNHLMKDDVVNNHNVPSNTVINKRVSLTLHGTSDVYASKTVDYMVL